MKVDVNRLLRIGAGRDRFAAVHRVRGDAGYEPSWIEFHVVLDREDGSGSVQVAHYVVAAGSASVGAPDSAAVPAQSYTVGLTAISCHLGGLRWFFVCPRTWARVTRLHMPLGAARFASRDAYRLIYQSQRSDRIQRGHGRLARAYAKLDGSYSTLGQPIPAKPKGMRWATYERLVGAIGGAQARHLVRCNIRLSERSTALRRAEHAIRR